MSDAINPRHYQDHPVFSGECWEVAKFCDFATGNAIKYLWRCGRKDDTAQELNKALWYVSQLPAPNISIIPQAVVDRLRDEAADALHDDHTSDLLWLTTTAILRIIDRKYQDAADLITMAIGRAS